MRCNTADLSQSNWVMWRTYGPMVEKGDTQSIEKICQHADELSEALLWTFEHALRKDVIDVASTILRKFPDNQKLWQTMDSQIDRGGAVRVMKDLDAIQSKEYAAILKVFAKTNASTYLSVLPEIITLGMGRAKWLGKMIPSTCDKGAALSGDNLDLVAKVKAILASTDESCYQSDQAFTTQPARFLEWFICLVNPEISIVLKEQLRIVHTGLDMPIYHQ